jgi:lysophospholipase L1-like esterase
VRLRGLVFGALAALVFAGAAAAAPGVHVERIRALAPSHGSGAGRVVVLVTVRYASTRTALLGAPDPSRTVNLGRLALTVEGTNAADADHLVRDSAGAIFYTHRVVLGPVVSARALSRGRVRLVVRASQIVRAGGRQPAAARAERRLFELPVRRVGALPRLPRPQCERSAVRASYARPTRIAVVCMGERARIRLTAQPAHGRARLESSRSGRAVLTYRGEAGYVGADRFALRATAGNRSVSAPVSVDVQQFKLRALGDSVTAGFGFLGSGTPWGVLSLPECIPPDTPNNRCSSNSPNGVGSGNPVGWSPDFGLSNQVAWPAQFAASFGLTGPGQYENWAVSGSTPADWAGGYLNSTLQGIVAGMPDLVVLTLGANPLLDTFLFGSGLECAVSFTDAELAACVQSFIDHDRVVPNLRSVLEQLLAAENTRLVVSQYHLAIPSTALFSTHQLELMFDVVNANIRRAAQGVDGFGTRLFLMAPPRFNVGLGPGNVLCPGRSFAVDGPSRQSEVTQGELKLDPIVSFCGSSEYWIVSADTGIHPSVAGHAQFAQALAQVALANNLVPSSPP